MEAQLRSRLPSLRTLTYVLVVMLVVLAAFAILYILLGILERFAQVIILFFVGALVAYLLSPACGRLQRVVRKRWAAVLLIYLLSALIVVVVSVLLVAPFVQQSQSLIDNLRNPPKSSLRGVFTVQDEARSLSTSLSNQYSTVASGSNLSPTTVSRTKARIDHLQTQVAALEAKSNRPASPQHGSRLPPAPVAQTRIPPRYVAPITRDTAQLAANYATATQSPRNPDAGALNRAASGAKTVTSDAKSVYKLASTTPIMLLNAQGWLDDHGVDVNLHDKFGQLGETISSRSASILNNAVGILLNAGTLLVNSFLILIISVYFLSDGGRLVRKIVSLAPGRYGTEAEFFTHSLDRVMGGYIRGQLLIALLAGILGGGGAAILGVPYPVLIGVSTFVLALVPVIGPVILFIPPVLISLIFNPLTTTIILLVYFLVFMQIVTNVIGPRIMGGAVGIHPLEAMAAALIGFPIAGLLGSFLAVPTVGFLHIAVREAVRFYRSEQAPAPAPAEPTAQEKPAQVATPS